MNFFSLLPPFKILNKRPIVNILVVGVVTILVKSMGFFKEMEVGKSYGLSLFIDTFLIASLIPGFVNNIFMVSFQNVFIPNYILEKRESGNINSFQSTCILITLILGITLLILSFLLDYFFLETFFKGHTVDFYSMIRTQFYIMLPCIIFWSLSSFFCGLLEINGLFLFSSIYPIITSLTIIFLLYFFKQELGYEVLSLGMLVGSFLEAVYLFIVSKVKSIIQLGKPNFFIPNIVIIYKQLPSKIGSGLLTGTTGFINQFFAVQLIAGSISALNYGSKIPSFLASILIISVGNVALPYFSKLVYEDREKAYKVLFRSIAYVFSFSTLIVISLYGFSDRIISVLFEKGKFLPKDTVIVAEIQQILLLYVPFYVSSILIIKFLTSINRNRYMFYASLLNLMLNLILNYYFVKLYKVNGLAIATTSVYIINFGVLFLCLINQKKLDSFMKL